MFKKCIDILDLTMCTHYDKVMAPFTAELYTANENRVSLKALSRYSVSL